MITKYYWSIQSVRLGANEAKELCATIRKGHFLPASRFRVVCERGDNGKVYWRSVMKVYDHELKLFNFYDIPDVRVLYNSHTKVVNHWLKHQKKWRKL